MTRHVAQWYLDVLIGRAAAGWTPEDVRAALIEADELAVTGDRIEAEWARHHRRVRQRWAS